MGSDKLNLKQETFCQSFVFNKECFGNATKSYAEAYNIDISDGDESVRGHASRLVANGSIKQRLQELLDILINDTVVDLELASVIKQNENLAAKVSAIKEYNAVKKRVEPPKVEIEIKISSKEKKVLDELVEDRKEKI